MSDTLSAEQINAIKIEGFMHNRGTRRFSARVLTKSGVLTSEQMRVLAQAAQTYGNGTLTLTIRMNIEIPGIDYDDIRPFQELIATVGLKTGGSGPRVRPILACKGTTCIYGLYDTQQLAADLYERLVEGYKDLALPHKFKTGVGGCPNNCAKPDTNDFGIVGQRVHDLDLDLCQGCDQCGIAGACTMKAASVKEGKLSVDRDLCNNCGRCIGKCPFGVITGYTDCLKIYVGGRWGRTVSRGKPLASLYTRDEVFDVMEKAILMFKKEGLPGERLGQTCERLGMERVNQILSGDELLSFREGPTDARLS